MPLLHDRSRSGGLRAVAAAATLALSLAGCANQPSAKPADTTASATSAPATTGADTIVVGEYGSMTGENSTFGTSTDVGIQLAVNQINTAGGIDGKKLTVKLYDDEGKPDQALNVVQKLIAQDNVTAVLGEVASTRSIAAAPACNTAKVPMISPSSTNPKVTTIGPYIFRVCFIDPFQGTAAAKFAIGTLHAKTAAIMTDAANDYSTGLTKFFTDAFTKQGGNVVINLDYGAKDLDFRSQLTKIQATNPDILYVPGYYNNVGAIAKQARAVGLTAPLLGGDGWDSEKLVEGAGGPGKALEGCFFTDHYSKDNPDPAVQKFVKDFEAANNGTPPSALAAMGYDAAEVLADSIKRAGKPDDGNYASEAYRTKLRDSIATTKDFQGITGKITIGPDRNAQKPAVVLQVKGDKFVYVTTVNP